MPTTPYTIERFGGLQLKGDPLELGAAGSVAQSNVDLDRLGRLRTRDGYTLVSSTAATTSPTSMSYYKDAAGVEYVVAASDTGTTTTTPYNLNTGASGTTVAEVAASNNGFARFGTTTTTYLYMSGANLKRFNGSTWTTVATGLSTSYFALAVTPNSNRLAIATVDTVKFSNAGAPETFSTNDFVTLHPGDGETLKALVTWRDYMFAFKQSKFFVFTGESTDSDGQPIFNYRAVTAGHGCSSHGSAVAGDEGVYFADETGIYLTTGDAPRCVSVPIEPWLRGISFSALPTFTLNGTDATGKAALTLAYHNGRLYVTDTANQTTLVYDPKLDAWLIWDLNATGMCAVPISGAYTTGIHFGESGTKKIAAHGTSTTDNGSAVSWSYQTGMYSPSDPGRVVVVPETSVDGFGTVTLAILSDLYASQSASATLGTSPTVAEGWPTPVDQEGRWLQSTLSGSGVALVSRVTHHISSVKPVGVR